MATASRTISRDRRRVTGIIKYTWALWNRLPEPFRWFVICLFVSRIVFTLAGYFLLHIVDLITINANALYPAWQVFGPHKDVLDVWFRWDSVNYVEIARYWYMGGDFLQFFPGYPLVIWLFHLIIPNWKLASLVAANTLLLAAGWYFCRLMSLWGITTENQRRAIIFFLAMPTAFLLSSALSESTLLAFTLASIYYASIRKWWLAGLLLVLVAATRSTGIFVGIPLLVIAWQQSPRAYITIFKKVLLLSPALLGLGAVMYISKVRSGHWLTFATIQRTAYGLHLVDPLTTFHLGFTQHLPLYLFTTTLITLIVGFMTFVGFYWLRNLSLWLFSLTQLGPPLLLGVNIFSSSLRYIVMTFPFLGLLFATIAKPRYDSLILMCLMMIQVIAFVAWIANWGIII